MSIQTKSGKSREQISQGVVSNGFLPLKVDSPSQPLLFSLDDAVALSKLPPETLRHIATYSKLPTAGDTFTLVERITGINVPS